MSAYLASLVGIKIASAVIDVGKTFAKIVAIGFLIYLGFTALPFTLSMPTSLYNFLIGDNVFDVLYLVGYIMPVDFLFNCLLIILISKYSNIIFSLVMTVVKWLKWSIG